MNGNIFTYGSLMFDEVWCQVVTGRYPSEPALLDHHQRHALTGLSYPGVVATPGAQVAGRLYRDVSAADIARDAAAAAEDWMWRSMIRPPSSRFRPPPRAPRRGSAGSSHSGRCCLPWR